MGGSSRGDFGSVLDGLGVAAVLGLSFAASAGVCQFYANFFRLYLVVILSRENNAGLGQFWRGCGVAPTTFHWLSSTKKW
jgi:3-isopropylmalate dehydratase small subunit